MVALNCMKKMKTNIRLFSIVAYTVKVRKTNVLIITDFFPDLQNALHRIIYILHLKI